MGTILNKIRGAVLGQAIGDALGSQTEFWKGKFVSDLGPTWGYPFPAFSDDTQNFLAIAEAFLSVMPKKGDCISIDKFMDEVARNFVRWNHGAWGANNRSPGGTCMGGVRMLEDGVDWRASGSTSSGKGNGGGAMRAAAVGIPLWKDPIFAFEIATLTAIPTHNNIETQISAGGTAFLVACAINGISFDQSVGSLLHLLQRWDEHIPEYTHSSEDIPFAIASLSTAYAMGKARLDDMAFKAMNGNDGKGIECLSSAIFHNAKHCRYSDVVVHTANYTGDSDSTSACAGAIAGARWGADFIKSSWKSSIEKSVYLHNLAEDLFKLTIDG